MQHLSQRTISLGASESSFLHFMHMMSVVVSSTKRENGHHYDQTITRVQILHSSKANHNLYQFVHLQPTPLS